MSETRSVVICDDHALIRDSVAKLVAQVEGLEVTGLAGDARELHELFAQGAPDVLILDIGLGRDDGLEVAADVRRDHPDVAVLMLSMHDGDSYLRRALELQVAGYVHKSSPTRELVQALEAVRDGSTYVDSALTRRALDVMSGRREDGATSLTAREREILILLSRGRRAPEIADELFLSSKTIKNHLTNVYAKLGVDSGTQAVAEAYRLGIVSVQDT